jgi:hypothetical protein
LEGHLERTFNPLVDWQYLKAVYTYSTLSNLKLVIVYLC